jgi:hypothetical protein
MLVWQFKMSENFVGPKAKISQGKRQREGGWNSKNHQKIEGAIKATGALSSKKSIFTQSRTESNCIFYL